MQIEIRISEEQGALAAEAAAILHETACVEAEADAFALSVQSMLADASRAWPDADEPTDAGMDIVEEPAAVVREAEEIVVGAMQLQREVEADMAEREDADEDTEVAPEAPDTEAAQASAGSDADADAAKADRARKNPPAAAPQSVSRRGEARRGGKGSR